MENGRAENVEATANNNSADDEASEDARPVPQPTAYAAADVRLKAEAIYADSLCELSLSAEQQVQLSLSSSAMVFQRVRAQTSGGAFRSSKDKDEHRLELLLGNCFTEQPTGLDSTNGVDGAAHGMSFYPFVSSELNIKFSCNLPVRSISLELPEELRVVWGSDSVFGPAATEPPSTEVERQQCFDPRDKATLVASHSEKRSIYYLSWKSPRGSGDYSIRIPLRIGGPRLFKTALFPIWYYLIAMVAVAAAASTQLLNALLTSLIAAWLFLLRHISASLIPRREVLLLYATLCFGLGLTIWGIVLYLTIPHLAEFFSWISNPTLCDVDVRLLVASSLAVAAGSIAGGIGGALMLVTHATRVFETTGQLPAVVARSWGRCAQYIQKRNARRRERLTKRQAKHAPNRSRESLPDRPTDQDHGRT